MHSLSNACKMLIYLTLRIVNGVRLKPCPTLRFAALGSKVGRPLSKGRRNRDASRPSSLQAEAQIECKQNRLTLDQGPRGRSRSSGRQYTLGQAILRLRWIEMMAAVRQMERTTVRESSWYRYERDGGRKEGRAIEVTRRPRLGRMGARADHAVSARTLRLAIRGCGMLWRRASVARCRPCAVCRTVCRTVCQTTCLT